MTEHLAEPAITPDCAGLAQLPQQLWEEQGGAGMHDAAAPRPTTMAEGSQNPKNAPALAPKISQLPPRNLSIPRTMRWSSGTPGRGSPLPAL